MSLCTFLTNTKLQYEKQTCQEDSTCKLPFRLHTQYWYHGDGCVQIKVSEVEPEHLANNMGGQNQFALETPIFIQVYCLECKRYVLEQDRIPNELLEMSFFKLLEQIFYNPKIQIAKARDQEALNGDPICPHSMFRQCELQFRYGSIKTILRFEKLEAYTLDMFHFGLEKGTATPEFIDRKVNLRLEELRTNLYETFSFVISKVDALLSFLAYGVDEIKRLIGN